MEYNYMYLRNNVEPNTIFTGDNLDIMRGINSESIDLIYLDPPFNSGRTHSATSGSSAENSKFNDYWSMDDIKDEWVDQLRQDHNEIFSYLEMAEKFHSKSMKSYLIMMAVRLMEMKRILKETGSIYLHCDPTASHYLKMLMDAIFGKDMFRNEIVWCYSNSGRNKSNFATKHDVIFFYYKTKNGKFEYTIPISEKYLASHYRQKDDQGRQCRKRVDHGKERIYYPSDGMTCNDWWADIPSLNSQAKERIGYPTQKPLTLLERIIRASSNEGDTILDPFCGSGTTCIAAENLNRYWIGIDLSSTTTKLIKERLPKAQYHLRTDIPLRSDSWNWNWDSGVRNIFQEFIDDTQLDSL